MSKSLDKSLSALCFNTVHRELDSKCPMINVSVEYPPDSPLFVTWKKNVTSLRGCIGTFECMDLSVGIPIFARKSAFNDSRFSRITLSELPLLNVSLSLLQDFEEISTWDAWEIGLHGIQLYFYDPFSGRKDGRRYTATFLPDVAVQQKWTKRQTIEALIKKSGFTGRIGDDLLMSLRVTRYSCCKSTITWAEYIQYMDDVLYVA